MSWLHANGEDGRHAPSLWAERAPPPDALPPLDGAVEADLCVVGGGLTGLSAALHAARAGMSVVLLEAQRLGWGASGRNGGQVGTGLNWSQRRLEARVGRPAARRVWDLTEQAKALTRELIAEHAPEAGWRPGVLAAAGTQAELEAKRAEADWMAQAYGTRTELLDRDGVAAMIGTRAYAGGVLDRSAGYCNPMAYSLGMARACLAAGVRAFERSEARRAGPGEVRTDRGAVRCRHVILAVNGYAPGLNAKLGARVLPINNYIAATAPLGARAPMREPVAVADSRFVVNYFWQDEAGRLIYGGGESYGRRFPSDIRGKVRANLARVYPDLADAELTHAWGGTLAVTATRLPYVAEVDRGMFAAAGYSGHGLALSALCGRAMARACAGERGELEALAALPVPALPGGRWIGGAATTAAMAWFSLRDRFTNVSG